MYATLGPHWAGTLLGLLEAVCIPIPIIFYVYGYRIRQKSALIRSMQEDKTKFENKRARAAERSVMARTEAEAEAGAGMETGAAVGEEVVEEKALGLDLEKGVAERMR